MVAPLGVTDIGIRIVTFSTPSAYTLNESSAEYHQHSPNTIYENTPHPAGSSVAVQGINKKFLDLIFFFPQQACFICLFILSRLWGRDPAEKLVG